MTNTNLKFGDRNQKLRRLATYMGIPFSQVVSFDIPAGFTCGKANICKTYANRFTGKLQRVGRVLCFAAKAENYLPSVRKARWDNYTALLACGTNAQAMADLILQGLPKRVKVVRIHSSGDFYAQAYFDAWIIVANALPNVTFFGYTKYLDYATAPKPANFSLQYSYGGLDDNALTEAKNNGANIPTCYIGEYEGQYTEKVVCGSHEKAHEDFFEIVNGNSFVINVH
jgi:hypothetical protein